MDNGWNPSSTNTVPYTFFQYCCSTAWDALPSAAQKRKAAMARKANEMVQFKLMVREGLRRKLEREAERKGQSANAEAVERLEKSFENQEIADIIARTAHEAAQNTLLVIEAKFSKPGGDWTIETEDVDDKDTEGAAAEFLRHIVRKLRANPGWDKSEAGRENMAQDVGRLILGAPPP
jgi:hypothetical protein